MEVIAITVGLVSGGVQILDLRLDRESLGPSVSSALAWIIAMAAIDWGLFTVMGHTKSLADLDAGWRLAVSGESSA